MKRIAVGDAQPHALEVLRITARAVQRKEVPPVFENLDDAKV